MQKTFFPREAPKKKQVKELASKWRTCKACPLCEEADHHVVYEGPPSPYTLFIGEAPGWTENLLGRPFIGPAGHLLKKMLQNERLINYFYDLSSYEPPSRSNALYGLSNILACVPWKGHPLDREVRPPSKEEALACRPRLDSLISILQPKLIVLLGTATKTLFKPPKAPRGKKLPYPTPTILHLIHPAAILRSTNTPEESIDYRRFILTLEETLNELPSA